MFYKMFKFLITIILFSLICGCSLLTEKQPQKMHKQNYISKKEKILLEKGIKGIKFGNYRQSIEALTQLTKLSPELKEGYYNLGLAYVNNGQTSEAIKSWYSAISIDKNYADAYFNLGKAYKTIDSSKSEKCFQKYISLRPDDPHIDTLKNEIINIKKSRKFLPKDLIIKKVLLSDQPYISTAKFDNMTTFSSSTPVIYSLIELNKLESSINIEIKWYYLINSKETVLVNSANFASDGSKNITVSLKKPVKDWPSGKYKMIISVENNEHTIKSFEIKGEHAIR